MYDFNKIIDRKGTSSWKYDFYEEYNKPSDTLSMWIADMDFPTVPEVVKRWKTSRPSAFTDIPDRCRLLRSP